MSFFCVEPKESSELVRLLGKRPVTRRLKSGLESGEVKILKMLVARSEMSEMRSMSSFVDRESRKNCLVQLAISSMQDDVALHF